MAGPRAENFQMNSLQGIILRRTADSKYDAEAILSAEQELEGYLIFGSF